MNLITAILFALAIAGTAAISSTPRVRVIKGVESSRNLQQYGGYNGGYNGGSSSSGGGSSHHKTKPKPKQKTTPKPKSHPKPKTSSHSSSSSSGGYSSQPSYGYSRRSSAYAYSAIGMLGIVAATIMAKKKCTAAASEEGGPDASDILEGDHETNSTITSIIGMTDAKQEGKAVYVERLKYIPSGIENVPPPAAVAAPAETDDNVTDSSAIV